MQLKRALVVVSFAFGTLAGEAVARAEVGTFDTSHMLYTESPTRTNMTVYTPGVDVSATPVEWATLRAGYEADIVSGASIAVKAGPAYQANNPSADVVTAASVKDVRHMGRGGLTLRNGDQSLTAGYAYGTENDYRSNSIFVTAKTEAYEHNTQFELTYSHNFDDVCSRTQGVNAAAPRFVALENSNGCFSNDPLRSKLSVDIDGFQGGWTQAWTPVFMSQLIYSAQIVDGFQSNPYRSVILGQGLKAQEHHPNVRTRQAVALRMNWFWKPLKAAFRLGLRAYDDTWDVQSGTVDAELEKYFGEVFRAAVRGRLYKQTAANFWSDDYSGGDPPLGPKGQYWTGDRELSPFWSYLVGVRLAVATTPRDTRILGIFTKLKAGASADMIQFNYDEYTLGGLPITNSRAFMFGLTAGATF